MNGRPTVAIITSITDGYDTLKKIKPQFGVDVEWIVVTDGREVREPDHGWEIMGFSPYDDPSAVGLLASPEDMAHPNRMAKLAKCQPWKITNAPYSIWIDGAYRVTSPLFAVEAIRFANPVAQFIHPWRDCLYEEAKASLALVKYMNQQEQIRLQTQEYSQVGHPPNWGLWAGGVIVRKHGIEIMEMDQQWLAEIRRWSYQDQISEPFALRLCDLRPNALPGDHIKNPWLSYEGSARHG